MSASDTLERGREACGRRAWGEAYARLAEANGRAPLEPDDLERLATAAYLTGRDAESEAAWARAHQELLNRGSLARAARCALRLAFALLDNGEHARGGGWIARARRLLDNREHDCVEQGYLLLPVGLRSIGEGDDATAHSTFCQAADTGDRFGDADLVALGRHGEGRALIRLGQPAEGMALLDEVMIAVTAGEVSPIVAGDVFCGVLSACQETFDLGRAREWTAAFNNWCGSQPDLVAYRGQCLVRHAEILQMSGDWPAALDAARRACERLSQPARHPGLGAAFYQRAEIHRLRGEPTRAADAYSRAGQSGRSPQPGLALLRLSQGRPDVAGAAIRRALDEAIERRTRSRLLGAYVEITLAQGDVAAARCAGDELSQIASSFEAPLLTAASAHATGAVLLAEGDARSALAALRRAWAIWRELEAPYEAARTAVLLGLACRALGDDEAGEMELAAARRLFERLGAAADLARVNELSRTASRGEAGGLTPRELEVLRLVATGMTNGAIAGELGISDKTVARHLSNIFTKLDLSTRAAATAYAYRNHLV